MAKLGSYFYQIKDYQKAEDYLSEALELSQSIGSSQVSQEIYADLSNLYYKTGRYKDAFDFMYEHHEIKDSLMNESKTKELTQITMQYEFDKKQELQELEQQKKDAIKEAQIKRQKLLTFFFLLGFVLMLFVAFLIFRSYKQKQKTNIILKDKNEQISLKNTQLNQQNEEIEAQRDEIERQKEFVERQNKEITSSINYAQRIQRALLTPLAYLQENFNNFFVLYKPRNIVSGDFYWASKVGEKLVITAADCTGHGVPGAFMSMLGVSFLNQIVNIEYSYKPEKMNAADILNKMRKMIIETLGHGSEDGPQEGMDMSLAIIDFESKNINIAAAYNSVYIIRNNEIITIPADRMPVGYHFVKINEDFTNKYFDFQKKDKVYMFTDGYQDQFGGDDHKKISPIKFREIILENNNLPMSEQMKVLDNFFINWIKNSPRDIKQIDDILVLGYEL